MPNFDRVARHPSSADTTHSTPWRDPSARRRPRRAPTRKQVVGMLAILALACLGLSACGGSSGSSSNAAATTAATSGSTGTTSTGAASTAGSTTPSGASGAGRARFGAMRECLQKNGVTLPQRAPGSGAPGGFAGGAPGLPKGVTRAQFEAALKKCGGGQGHYFRRGGARRLQSPAFKAALTAYASCLRQNGIDIPAPNTSGKGPIFSTKGIDTTSAKFRQATMKCRASLAGAFRRPQGAPGASGESSPQTGTTTKSPEASR